MANPYEPTPKDMADMKFEMAAFEARYAIPPCLECGATSQQDAERRCICSGDKDDCHGCTLWPDALTATSKGGAE